MHNKDIHVCVLGSSSSGNCTIIWDGDNIFMVDCGLPLNRVKSELELLGVDVIDITACFITHAHSDHVNNALFNEFARNSTPVIMCKSTLLEIKGKYKGVQALIDANLVEEFYIEKGKIEEIDFEPYYFQPFVVKHDCPGGCFGFIVQNDVSRKSIVIATDFGTPQQKVIENFYDSDLIILESNYDEDMLSNSGREPELIERVQRAHVSNDVVANMLVDISNNSTRKFKNVILTHLSPECNTHRKALSTIRNFLREAKVRSLVTSAYKNVSHIPITI